MSERLERLQREIAAEKQAALAELGMSFSGPLLILGDRDVGQVIAQRLEQVPAILRIEGELRLRQSVLRLPWVVGRRVATNTETVGLQA